jgi:hypothetical protein
MPAPIAFVDPLPITAAMVTASSVPEDDYAAYSSGTTYADAARVVYAHNVYESLQGSNLDHTPDEADSAWWSLVGPTNRMRCFDGRNSSQTAQANDINYTLEPVAAVSDLAVLNVTGALELHVSIEHPTYGELYDNTVEMTSLPALEGYWEWCFGERTAASVAVLRDLPGIPGCTIQIDLTGTTELAVGVILLGQGKEIGMGVLAGARVGITDYSRTEANDWGEVVLVERAFAKRAQFDFPIEAALVDEAYEYFTAMRAKPLLVIGSRQYGATVIFGFIKEFEVLIAYASHSECSLSVQGLT